MARKSEDSFAKPTIVALASRAAQRCSNPSCGATTSGPSSQRNKAINVGEAAHIYGATLGSARYDPSMTPNQRADITNAIWLCRNCHGLIDRDERKFPAGLLFEWQNAHEARVMDDLGKTSGMLRQRFNKRHLRDFGSLTYLAERLINEKPDHWEYKLTTEVLRAEMAPVLRRWQSLSRGLYVQPIAIVSKDDSLRWLMVRLTEAGNLAEALAALINGEFQRSWGETGVPGGDLDIVHTCQLFSRVCDQAVDWEERIRFTILYDYFRDVGNLFPGVVGGMIDEAARFPAYLSEVFGGEVTLDNYELNLELSLPDGWPERVHDELKKVDGLITGIYS